MESKGNLIILIQQNAHKNDNYAEQFCSPIPGSIASCMFAQRVASGKDTQIRKKIPYNDLLNTICVYGTVGGL